MKKHSHNTVNRTFIEIPQNVSTKTLFIHRSLKVLFLKQSLNGDLFSIIQN